MSTDKTKRAIQHLKELSYLPFTAEQIEFIYDSASFKQRIIELIRQAESRIYITALYWQNDEAGQQILNEIYCAKQKKPALDVKILVDWHRAQRNLLGAEKTKTNSDWYNDERLKNEDLKFDSMFFGVPVNTREVFGVLHIKGFVFDNTVLYSGASINNVYLNQLNKYRYDRYHLINNSELADSLVNFIQHHLLAENVVLPLDVTNRPKTKEIRQSIRTFRKNLATKGQYKLQNTVSFKEELSISPLFGLGNSRNILNRTIKDLFRIVEKI